MCPPSTSARLEGVLRSVKRRFRLPHAPQSPAAWQHAPPSTAVAATAVAAIIENARLAVEAGTPPGDDLRRGFCTALARLIDEAMSDAPGDAAYRALVLRHIAAPVREYASLQARARRDRRAIRIAADAVAHPARLARIAHTPLRAALAALHAAPTWTQLADMARATRAMPENSMHPHISEGLGRLLDDPALARLCRMESLQADPQVQRYRQLWEQNGPAQGSAAAAAQGAASRQRGDEVEALAARALQALADLLNRNEDAYRVVTSMRVPAAMPASARRAKSEWDAVLLRRAPHVEAAWDICVLVEAKASADAAATDLPRLLRGLRLMAEARPDTAYTFATRQGPMTLRGSSLAALPTCAETLAGTVLYCCNAPADAGARLLSAASRMQLLSAPASLDYAGRLARGETADANALEPVWRLLLDAPAWRGVLHQYPLLRQARELMVHPEDLLAAIAHAA